MSDLAGGSALDGTVPGWAYPSPKMPYRLCAAARRETRVARLAEDPDAVCVLRARTCRTGGAPQGRESRG